MPFLNVYLDSLWASNFWAGVVLAARFALVFRLSNSLHSREMSIAALQSYAKLICCLVTIPFDYLDANKSRKIFRSILEEAFSSNETLQFKLGYDLTSVVKVDIMLTQNRVCERPIDFLYFIRVISTVQ